MIPRRTAIPRIQPPVLSSGVTVGSTEICANAAVAGRKSTRSAPSVAALSHLMRRDARIPRPPSATREPEMGFEPMTYHLRGGCSATELLRRETGRIPTPLVETGEADETIDLRG